MSVTTALQCKFGHAEGRYANGNCKTCQKEKSRRRAASDPDRHRRRVAAWRAKNPEENGVIRRRSLRKASTDGYFAKWRERNRDKCAIYGARYERKNPTKLAAKDSRRRAAKKLRCPVWSEKKEIEAIYEMARRLTVMTGTVHHVDHDLPLIGKKVSGLHVAANLKVIPASENHRKSNKFEPR